MSQRGPDPSWQGSELAPGALVTPSIRVQRMLGSGGMGSVWLAEHLTLHALVVVKFMAPEYAHNPEARQRFEREATLLAQAKSPHVVQVFDHGIALFGLPYIAMELLEGEDLGKRIERAGRIEPRLFADWLTQACRGLARAHAKGITHRDIKPENIFLCEDDGRTLVKVLDFGIAKLDAGAAQLSGTQTGTLLGTAYYMSPEQTLGQKDVDPRADLWALGVVAYYALTGRRPFTGATVGALAIEITSAPIVPPSRHDPGLGPGVDAWLAKALARPREQRFQSAKEMAELFEQALAQLSLGATTYDSTHSAPLAAATLASNAPPALPTASTMSPSTKNATGAANAATAPSAKPGRTAPWFIAASVVGLSVAAVVALREGSSLPPTAASSPQHASAVPVETPSPTVQVRPPSEPLPSPSPSAEAAPAAAAPVAPSARPNSSKREATPHPALSASAARPAAVPTSTTATAAPSTSNKPSPKSPLKMQIQ